MLFMDEAFELKKELKICLQRGKKLDNMQNCLVKVWALVQQHGSNSLNARDVHNLFFVDILACLNVAEDHLGVKKLGYLYFVRILPCFQLSCGTNYGKKTKKEYLDMISLFMVMNRMLSDMDSEIDTIHCMGIQFLSKVIVQHGQFLEATFILKISEKFIVSVHHKSTNVRKFAVLGLAKLYPSIPKPMSFTVIDELYQTLQDEQAEVAANAALALHSIYSSQNGTPVNRRILDTWMNWLSIVNCEQLRASFIQVLTDCSYCAEDRQAYPVDNVLQILVDAHVFTNGDDAMALTAMRFVSKMVKTNTRWYTNQIVPLISNKMNTMIASDDEMVRWKALKHLGEFPLIGTLTLDMQHLQINNQDSFQVQIYALKALVQNIQAENVPKQFELLMQHMLEGQDNGMISHCVKAIADMYIKLKNKDDTVSYYFLQLLNKCLHSRNKMKGGAVIAIKRALVASPYESSLITIVAKLNDKSLWVSLKENIESMAAFVWLLGRYPREIKNNVADVGHRLLVCYKWSSDSNLRGQILYSAVRLFVVHPNAMKQSMKHVLLVALADKSEWHVHDRARFYCRLLKQPYVVAQQILRPSESINHAKVHQLPKMDKNVQKILAPTTLLPNSRLESASFEHYWGCTKHTIRKLWLFPIAEDTSTVFYTSFQASLAKQLHITHGIRTIASGIINKSMIDFFLFAHDTNDGMYFSRCTLNMTDGAMSATLKGNDDASLDMFATSLQGQLQSVFNAILY